MRQFVGVRYPHHITVTCTYEEIREEIREATVRLHV